MTFRTEAGLNLTKLWKAKVCGPLRLATLLVKFMDTSELTFKYSLTLTWTPGVD